MIMHLPSQIFLGKRQKNRKSNECRDTFNKLVVLGEPLHFDFLMEISQCLKQLEKQEVVSVTRNHRLQFQRKVSCSHCFQSLGFWLQLRWRNLFPRSA